jgi:hypothetical protein
MFANINPKDSFFAEAVLWVIEVIYSKQLERGNCAHFRTWYQSYRYNPSETERAYGINEKEREK